MSRRDRQRPRLSDEDVRLWSMVTERVTAAPVKPRVPNRDSAVVVPRQTPTATSSEGSAKPRTRGNDGPVRPGGVAAASVPVRQGPAAQAPKPTANVFTRRETRRLKSGHHDIDARIDLHGMREAEAHSALRGFIMAAVARGYSTVLVITGKGGAAGGRSHGAADDWADGDRRQRGVLRRNVPRWLAEPDVAPFVVGHAAAHIRHGGEGAVYVRLRRKERPGR